jgi:hypothetical protein
VAPSRTEEFSLRLLLVSVAGPTSFEDLRTYNGVEYATFREAAAQRGLCDGDGEYVACMEEAAGDHSPRELRSLFVTIVIHCGIANPLEMYNRFSMHMAEDYVHRERNSAVRHSSPASGDDSGDDEVATDLAWRRRHLLQRRHRHRSTGPVVSAVLTSDPDGAVSDDLSDVSVGGSDHGSESEPESSLENFIDDTQCSAVGPQMTGGGFVDSSAPYDVVSPTRSDPGGESLSPCRPLRDHGTCPAPA